MAYDEALAERTWDALTGREGVSERKMFGGLAFTVGGNMACGVINQDLMVRLEAEDAERALSEQHTRPMDFTGRPMKGFPYVAPAGTDRHDELAAWVELAADHAASLPPKQGGRPDDRLRARISRLHHEIGSSPPTTLAGIDSLGHTPPES